MDLKAAQEDELRARHQIVTVAGTSGAAIAYDYRPSQPISVREVAIGGHRDCRCLARRDQFVFAGIHGGLVVLDATDPRNPQIVGTLALPGTELVDLALAGTTLYAADFIAGVHAFDVTDPRQPRYVSTHPPLTHSSNRRVLVRDNVAVLVNDHAISVFDVAMPGQFRPIALHHRLHSAVGWLRSAVLAGTHLYVTQGPMGLWTFDLADPVRPRVVAGQEVRLDTRPNERLVADSCAVFGGRIFVGTSSGIWVARLGPGAPTSESFFTGPGYIRDVARGVVRDGHLQFCVMEPHDHVLHVFDGEARYLGRQRLNRMIDRLYDLLLGDGYWIAAAGTSGVLFTTL